MAKKKLVVPQEGTQPAPSPIQNMISGSSTTPAQKKKPTSFNLDPEFVLQFKAKCASQGRSMTEVMEELMKNYVQNS